MPPKPPPSRPQGAPLQRPRAWLLLLVLLCWPAAACGPDVAPAERLPPDPVQLDAERLLAAGKWSEAAALLERVVQRRPDDGRALLLLGSALHKQKQYARARPWLERAASLTDYDRHEGASYFLGWCLLNLGELDGAARAFERHLELRPEEGDAHFGLGLVSLERGDDAAALVHFGRAVDLGERAALEHPERRADVAKAHARIADVLLSRGDVEGARDRLQLALNLWPQQATVAYKLAEVLRELGDERGAEEVLRQAERLRAAPPLSEGGR